MVTVTIRLDGIVMRWRNRNLKRAICHWHAANTGRSCAVSGVVFAITSPAARRLLSSPFLFAPVLFGLALDRWCCRILALDPVPRPAGAVGRAKALRYDAFEPEPASVANSLSVSVSYKGALLFPSK
jgi:hypothetical protein